MKRCIGWTLLAVAVLAACAGGGGLTTPSAPGGGPNGQGAHPQINQTVNLVLNIPPLAASSSTLRRPNKDAPGPAPSSLYVSPNTGSVIVTLGAINGISLAQAVAPITVNVPNSCAPAGCSVPISNVPAAIGTDTYTVETFVGQNGQGALISSGVINITVPATGPQAINSPSAALIIGGFVASVDLSVAPAQFVQGTPATASLVVLPKDATGAIIIGNDRFANPITISISDTSHFALNGVPGPVTLTGPMAAPISLTYNGQSAGNLTVTAATVDGNGNAVTASVTVPITFGTPPPPTPTPQTTPTPVGTPGPMSLYVLDANNNAVDEFRSPSPGTTPSRSFGLSIAQLGCDPAQVPLASAMVQGITADSAGNVYVSNSPTSTCNPNATPPYSIFQFGPSAVASSPPTAVFQLGAGAYSANSIEPYQLALNPTNGLIETAGVDSQTATPALLNINFFGGSGSISSVSGGGPCIPLPGFSTCDGTNQYSQTGFGLPFAVDPNGFTYLGGLSDLNGNPAIAAFSPGTGTPAVPYSALDGPQSDTQLGSAPAAMAVAGTTLYVLNVPSFGIGLWNCGPAGDTNDNCTDQQLHEYVTAYDTTKLTGAGARGRAVDLVPKFELGGDTVGRFGSAAGTVAVGTGQRLTANGSSIYIANPTGPVCSQACSTGIALGTAVPPAEIDIYNVLGLSGARTDVPPAAVIPTSNLNIVPDGLTFGRSGSATGPILANRYRHMRQSKIYRPRRNLRRRM